MFMTIPSFEQWVPQELGPPGARYWRAMTLTSGLHWFLLTREFETEENLPAAQTWAVGWETTLRSLLQDRAAESVVAVNLVELSGPAGSWTIRRVAEVWLPSKHEEVETGPLLFKLDGENGLCDSFRNAVGTEPGRQLLTRLNT